MKNCFLIDYSGSLKNLLKGHVEVKCTKPSVSGLPGSGKSCLMKLLLYENEDPPFAHHKCPVTTVPEVRLVTITPYEVGETTWSKVDFDSLRQMVDEDIVHYFEERCKDNSSTTSAHFEGMLPSIQTVPQFSESLSPSVHCTVKNEILHKLRSVEESPQLFKSHWIYAVDSGGQSAFIDIAPVWYSTTPQ